MDGYSDVHTSLFTSKRAQNSWRISSIPVCYNPGAMSGFAFQVPILCHHLTKKHSLNTYSIQTL